MPGDEPSQKNEEILFWIDISNQNDYAVAFTSFEIDLDGIALRTPNEGDLTREPQQTQRSEEGLTIEEMVRQAELVSGRGPEGASEAFYCLAERNFDEDCQERIAIGFSLELDGEKNLAEMQALSERAAIRSLRARLAEDATWHFVPSTDIELSADRTVQGLIESVSTGNRGTFQLQPNSAKKVGLKLPRAVVEEAYRATWAAVDAIISIESPTSMSLMTRFENLGGNVNLTYSFANGLDAKIESREILLFDRASHSL